MEQMITKKTPEYPIINLIQSRWSPRSFTEKPVSEADLMSMFEAARWSFSCANYQPWNYYYADQSHIESFETLYSCLDEGNKKWAHTAAVLLVGVIKKTFDNGKMNEWAKHDLGAANMSFALQGQSLSIYSHFMAGFDKEKTVEVLQLNPDEYEPVTFGAIGYLGEPDKLIEPYKTRETTPGKRKPAKEFIHQV